MKQVLNSAENKKKKWAKPGSFCLFSFFSHEKYSSNTINEKSVDGVLGTRTRASRMVGADESTEQWRHLLKEVIS